VMCTAGYLAPEQAEGHRATAASDRYALGVVAFELLTGARPFESDTPTAEAAAHVHKEVPSVRGRTDLPYELDDVFRKALAKDPKQRYGTCAEFVAALRGALDEAAGVTQALPLVFRRPRRRAPLWSLLALGIVMAVVAGVALAAVLTGGGSGAKPKAAAQPRTAAATTAPPAPATTPPATTATAAPDGHALNDQAYALMQQGNFAGALPLLQQAVQKLQGTGPTDAYEGYATYNLGYTLLQLGRCQDAITYLQRAAQLEPGNAAVQAALQQAQACVNPPPPKEHGHGKHKGHD